MSRPRRGRIRLLAEAALAAVLVLAAAVGPVTAKMPFFTVEVVPEAPIADEPVLVVVRMWTDENHTVPAAWYLEPTMDSLLVFRSSEGNDSVPVTLHSIEPDRYEAHVTLPAGDWTLVAFPDRSGWSTPEVPSGYPDTIAYSVRERGRDVGGLVLPLIVTGILITAGLRLRPH
jgi:hypothetical protein